jgi:putative membrane protein
MEDRKFPQYLVITLKGLAMGAADVVPGVSGGTIAFISGIYVELITTINQVNLSLLREWRTNGFRAFWKKLNGNFILALLLGIGISVLSLARLISWLLLHEPILLWSFFFGLVVASILFVGKAIEKWNALTMGMLLLGTALAYYITTLPPIENTASLPFLFFSGALAICAMILPGISGAFILVLLGSYKTVLDAVHEQQFKILGTVALGAIFGLLSFARLLKWMFTNFKNMTLALLTGFIMGSLNKIWPWKEILEVRRYDDKIIPVKELSISPFNYQGDPKLLLALLLAAIGFSLIFILEKIASKTK